MNEKGVSNNKQMRSVSDRLDSAMGWSGERKDASGARGFIHGVYHGGVGVGKYVWGNSEGAHAEWNRAGEQFSKSKNVGRSPPRSNKNN